MLLAEISVRELYRQVMGFFDGIEHDGDAGRADMFECADLVTQQAAPAPAAKPKRKPGAALYSRQDGNRAYRNGDAIACVQALNKC
jgi:hypothetical protein